MGLNYSKETVAFQRKKLVEILKVLINLKKLVEEFIFKN